MDFKINTLSLSLNTEKNIELNNWSCMIPKRIKKWIEFNLLDLKCSLIPEIMIPIRLNYY